MVAVCRGKDQLLRFDGKPMILTVMVHEVWVCLALYKPEKLAFSVRIGKHMNKFAALNLNQWFGNVNDVVNQSKFVQYIHELSFD